MQSNTYSKFLLTTLITIFVISFLYTLNPQITQAEDWLTGWSYRKKITIDHSNVDTDLTDFPLLVKITEDSDISTALANGHDIRFTTQDGTTLLSYERESWQGGNGSQVTAVIWVKVPSISATTNTDIYMYYGKSDAEDGQDATNVWDSNFKGVYHLNDPINPLDATSNNNDGTNHGTIAATGKIGGAGNFDGISSSVGLSNLTISNSVTISSWIKMNSSTGTILGFCGDLNSLCTGGDYSLLTLRVVNNAVQMYLSHTQNMYRRIGAATGAIISQEIWFYVTGVINNYATNDIDLYVNGEAQSITYNNVSSGGGSLTMSPFLGSLWIVYNNSSSTYFNGLLDETRISSTARTAEWIKFEYNNMNSSNNELSFAVQQYAPAPTPSNLTATANLNTISLTVDTFPNHTAGQSGYYFESSTGNNSGWIQTNTWQETNLNYDKEYTYTVKYRNGNAIETTTISTTQSTPFASFGTVVLQPQSSEPTPTPQEVIPTPESQQQPEEPQPTQQQIQEQKQALITEIKAKLVELIIQLIVLLQQQVSSR